MEAATTSETREAAIAQPQRANSAYIPLKFQTPEAAFTTRLASLLDSASTCP